MSQIVTNPTDAEFTPGFGGGVALIGFEGKVNRLEAKASNVTLIAGGNENDILSAGQATGGVIIYGFGGNDVIYGGAGDNELYGNIGDDVIYGLGGADLIAGGQGADVLYGGEGNDSIFGDIGNDFVSGGGGDDLIAGGVGDDILQGNAGNDVIWGEQGADNIDGGDGNDTMYGGQQNDVINGGAGNDYIFGDKGNDVLTGGAGNDRFVLTSLGSGNSDTVTDFTSGSDKIALSQSVFGAVGASVEASEFAVIANFDASNPGNITARLVYDSSSGRLFYLDGGTAQEVAQFAGNPNITAGDFELF